MDITWARQMYRTMSIFNMPLRVCHYDRVSSDTEEQLNSLANQNFLMRKQLKITRIGNMRANMLMKVYPVSLP